MPSCYVENCDSGSAAQLKRNNGEKKIFFSPCTDEMLYKWSSVIGRKDKLLTRKHKICQLHFADSDVETHFIHKFPDGTIQKLKRDRALLKKGSLPIIVPPQSTTENPQRSDKKSSSKNKNDDFAFIDLNTFYEHSYSNSEDLNLKHETVNSNIENLDFLNGDTSYDFILKNCNRISSKLKSWSVASKNDCIIWMYFEDDEQFPSKFIKLESDLKLKVCVGRTQLAEFCKIKNIKELLLAFHAVSNLLPCFGTDFENPEACEGYVFRKQKCVRGPQTKLCASCHKFRLNLRKKEMRHTQRHERLRNVIEARRKELKLVKRKMFRLQRKVLKMQKKMRLMSTVPKKKSEIEVINDNNKNLDSTPEKMATT